MRYIPKSVTNRSSKNSPRRFFISSELIQLTLCSSTRKTPRLRIDLMQRHAVEFSYMPENAVVPAEGMNHIATVMPPNRISDRGATAFLQALPENVSKRNTIRNVASTRSSGYIIKNCE